MSAFRVARLIAARAIVVSILLAVPACSNGDEPRGGAGRNPRVTQSTTTTTRPVRVPAPQRVFCDQFERLADLMRQVPDDGEPNLAAATQIVVLQQHLVDAAPSAALGEAATHLTDEVLVRAEGRIPTAAEAAAARAALQELTKACEQQ